MNAYDFFVTEPVDAKFMIEYRSDVPITARGKKDGITSIVKIVVDQTRTGKDYNTDGTYKPSDNPSKKPAWWHHQKGHEYRIAEKNSDPSQLYAICAPFENKTRHTTYLVNGGKIVTFDWLLSKGYVYAPAVEEDFHPILLRLDNIMAINGEICS